MRLSAFFFLLCCVSNMVRGQEAVYFLAGDGLKIRGDLYLHDYKLPFIILCHQEGSNRSEFYDIAPRLLNLNYNCLAVDLRAGGKAGFTENETALKAQMESRPKEMLDVRTDLLAAIDYVHRFNKNPVILFGSSYSASLCLLAARDNPRVQAVVAFSPGEYFQPGINMAEEISRINKPVFISGSQSEFIYLQKMTIHLAPDSYTLFIPEQGRGEHGARALTCEGAACDEYWFALMLFFKQVIRDL
jgi:pimeloyl-ACP methyl ester carboxylesterase